MPNHEAGDEAEAKIIEKQPMISVDQSHFTSEDAGEDSSEPQSLWSKVCCCFNDTNDKPNVKDDGLDKANENVISEYPVKPNVVIPGGNQQEESREDAKSKSEKAVSTSMAASMAATMAATMAAATAVKAAAVKDQVESDALNDSNKNITSFSSESESDNDSNKNITSFSSDSSGSDTEEAESKDQVESDALNDSNKNITSIYSFSKLKRAARDRRRVIGDTSSDDSNSSSDSDFD